MASSACDWRNEVAVHFKRERAGGVGWGNARKIVRTSEEGPG